MKALVTGGAGFIGSSLTEALVIRGWNVTVLDNLSTGSKTNLAQILRRDETKRFEMRVGDCTRVTDARGALGDCDILFHLAANPEVRMDLTSPAECFRQNIFAAHVVLEAFRRSKASIIVFASTSTVYGDANVFPTPEEYSPLEPISVYAASKLSGEALIASYCHAFRKKAIILRLANVVGPRSKRGVICDFVANLKQNSKRLKVLGDGTQSKSYIHVDDCVDAMLTSLDVSKSTVEVFNVGSEDHIGVRAIAGIVAEEMGLKSVGLEMNETQFEGRGWQGDVKRMWLDIRKLKSRGWYPRYDSKNAVRMATKQILADMSHRLVQRSQP